jgi:hypothetical protein
MGVYVGNNMAMCKRLYFIYIYIYYSVGDTPIYLIQDVYVGSNVGM